MKKYALYDTYETETEPGELLCTSDSYLDGNTDFTVPEALKIRNTFFEGYRIDYLFAPNVLSDAFRNDAAV